MFVLIHVGYSFIHLSICLLSFLLGVVKIIPCENSRTFVNGKLVIESTVLRSGKLLQLQKKLPLFFAAPSSFAI